MATSHPAIEPARRMSLRWRLISTALTLLTVGSLSACDGDGTGPSGQPPAPIAALPRALTSLEQDAVRASNGFGIALLRETAADNPGENVVLSPLSASIALGMAYAGAEGATADSMRRTLGWDEATRADILAGYRELPTVLSGLDPQVTFTSANSLWIRDAFPVKSSYTQEMEQVFSADVRTSNFGPTTVAAMNAWASENTNGRITEVVTSLPADLVAMLMNAIYFKGSWRARFDPARTQSSPFTTSAGASPSVPTMNRTDSMAYAQARGAQMVQLPYGNTAYVMTLVLPESGTSPRAWLDGLDASTLNSLTGSLSDRLVELSLPKFRLAVDFQLQAPLTAMGMGIAFSEGDANFSRIADDNLFLTHVKQDVYIDVNEAGTEAAAVTQVGVGLVSVPVTQIMRLDRPFVFFIRERLSGTILFAGIIEHPQS